MGKADQYSNILIIAINESSSAVNGIDPKTAIINIQISINIGAQRKDICLQARILILDVAFKFLTLLPNDLQSWEMHFDSFYYHGLDFIICLRFDIAYISDGIIFALHVLFKGMILQI